jgi:hypothetical protein
MMNLLVEDYRSLGNNVPWVGVGCRNFCKPSEQLHLAEAQVSNKGKILHRLEWHVHSACRT